MAVYPQRIVLKNSTDGDAGVQSKIRVGGTDEIVDGELVISQRPGGASLFTKDTAGSIVAVGAADLEVSVFPTLFDDFEAGGNETPLETELRPYTAPDSGLAGTGSHALRLGQQSWASSVEHGLKVGFRTWTLEFWIKADSDPALWPADPEEDIETNPNADFCLVMSQRDYIKGPGAFNIYLDGGLESEGGTGTSTSNTTAQARGSIVFGLNPGSNVTHTDTSIPLTGEIVSSRSTTVMDNQWHHVIFQHEGGGTYACFVDGTLIERKQLQAAIDHNNLGNRTSLNVPLSFTIGVGSEILEDDSLVMYPVLDGVLIDSFALWEYAPKLPGRHQYTVPTSSVVYELLGQPANSFKNLVDTDVSDAIADGDVLVWDAVNDYWRTSVAPAADISGSTLGMLANVNLAPDGHITSRQVLSWSTLGQEWVNRPLYLADTDVITYGKAEGHVVFYDGVDWLSRDLDYSYIANRPLYLSDLHNDLNSNDFFLNGLGDVLVQDLAEGHVLVWNDTESQWHNQPRPDADLSQNILADIGDVKAPEDTIQLGSSLVYDNQINQFVYSQVDYLTLLNRPENVGDFINDKAYINVQDLNNFVSVAEHVDVTVDPLTVQEGQMLIWRGTTWTNEYGPPANISFSKIAELADVENTYDPSLPSDGGVLTFEKVSTISFDSPTAASGQTFAVEWVGGSGQGVQISTFRTIDDTGSHVRATRTEGIDLRSDINFFRLRGKPTSNNNRPELRFESGDYNRGVGDYIGFKPPLGLAESQTYVLPGTDGDPGDVIATDGQGNLSWIARSANSSLGSLDDVDLGTVAPVTGNTLVYRSDIQLWVPGTVDDVDLATSSIGDLQDVDLTSGITDGQAMLWSAADSKFVPGDAAPDLSTQSIGELLDVQVTGANHVPAQGDVLSWHASMNHWMPVAPTLAALDDLDLVSSTPQDGETLVYDATLGKWVPGPASANFPTLTNLPTAIDGGSFGSG